MAMEEIVVMIPEGVLYQPSVIMMEDGHRIPLKSVLPSMISQIPYLERRPRTIPHIVSATALATIAVCLVLISVKW